MSAGAKLALDQSLSNTGWALQREAGGGLISGAWPLCDGISRRALGFLELWRKLDAFNKGHGLGEIIHESPSFGAVNQGEEQLISAIGLIAVIELFAQSRSIAVASYPARTWRGTWFNRDERRLLKGKSWKHPAVLRARQFGFDPVSGDEAEAIGILDHHLMKSKITPPWRSADLLLSPIV